MMHLRSGRQIRTYSLQMNDSSQEGTEAIVAHPISKTPKSQAIRVTNSSNSSLACTIHVTSSYHRWIKSKTESLLEKQNLRLDAALKLLMRSERLAYESHRSWRCASERFTNAKIFLRTCEAEQERDRVFHDFAITASNYIASAPDPPPEFPLRRQAALFERLGQELRRNAACADWNLRETMQRVNGAEECLSKHETAKKIAKEELDIALKVVETLVSEYQFLKDERDIVLTWLNYSLRCCSCQDRPVIQHVDSGHQLQEIWISKTTGTMKKAWKIMTKSISILMPMTPNRTTAGA